MFIREFSQFLPALQSYTISFAYFTLSIYTFFFESWRGSEQVSPRCPNVEWGLFWAQGNQDPEGSWKRNFYFSLKEFILGDLPIIRVITKKITFYDIYL